jgi:hypothetical protein
VALLDGDHHSSGGHGRHGTQEHAMTEKIVHCKKEPFDVYIGRPSKWGNPFSIGKDGTREQVISKYREWLGKNGSQRLHDLHELEGKTLGCWCKPQACHGDVLIELIKKRRERKDTP